MTDAGLKADFDTLAGIGRDPDGGWTRPAYGKAECEAHAWFAETARAAGLSVTQDAFGNSFARREGRAGAASVAIGSHLDTVKHGGLYDGALGVLAGLEVARRIAPSPDHAPLEIIAFRDEEGRFGALTGSRAMIGDLADDALSRMRDVDGAMVLDAMREAGLCPEGPHAAKRDLAEIAAYLELHIEQGPVLETSGESIGIVSAIAGQRRLSLRFIGVPGHAGTTPMAMRRDAFAAAAEFSVRFRDMLLAGGDAARGTIGIVNNSPNQGNVIPAEVKLGLEIRSASESLLAQMERRITEIAGSVGQAHSVETSTRNVYAAKPVVMDATLAAALEASARASGYTSRRLLSGANHDAGIIGSRLPAAMLFVPSRRGISHAPEEHTDWHHITAAVSVLENAVRGLLMAEQPSR